MYVAKREFKIFFLLFFFLSLSMHYSAWIDHPILHLKLLEQSTIGWVHPIVFTLVIYILIVFLRSIIKIFKSLRKRLSH